MFAVPQQNVCKAEPQNAKELSDDNEISCPECGDRYQRIHEHMRVHDSTDRPYACELGCNNFHFTSIGARNTHYVAVHKQVNYNAYTFQVNNHRRCVTSAMKRCVVDWNISQSIHNDMIDMASGMCARWVARRATFESHQQLHYTM